MSLYEIKTAFANSLALFYQSSLGSLHLTISKLAAKGWISVLHQESGGRKKRTYEISQAGKEAFASLMTAALPEARLEETALSRVYFFDHVDRKIQVQVLDTIIERIQNDLGQLEGLAQQFGLQIQAESKSMSFEKGFPLITLDYGVRSFRLGLEWFMELRKKLNV